MTEEERNQLIDEGKLNPDGTPIEPANDGRAPEDKPKGDDEVPTLTQKQVDAIIADRLRRDREAREAKEKEAREEAERKRLEETSEFQKLYEQSKQELEKLKEDALEAKRLNAKTSLLSKAGYSPEQVERYAKFIEGDTDDEMQAAVEQLKADVPPKATYVDPKNAGNNQREKPNPTDKEEKGRSIFQRLKAEGRIR